MPRRRVAAAASSVRRHARPSTGRWRRPIRPRSTTTPTARASPADDDSYSRFWDADGGRLRQGRHHLGRQQRSAGRRHGGLARHCLQRHQRRQRGEQAARRRAATTSIATSSSRGPTHERPQEARPDGAAHGYRQDRAGCRRPGAATIVAPGERHELLVAGHGRCRGGTRDRTRAIADPRAVKALLINSADDLGTAGWDTAYGWGYLNGQRAYDERASTVLATVGAPGSATGARLYEPPGRRGVEGHHHLASPRGLRGGRSRRGERHAQQPRSRPLQRIGQHPPRPVEFDQGQRRAGGVEHGRIRGAGRVVGWRRSRAAARRSRWRTPAASSPGRGPRSRSALAAPGTVAPSATLHGDGVGDQRGRPRGPRGLRHADIAGGLHAPGRRGIAGGGVGRRRRHRIGLVDPAGPIGARGGPRRSRWQASRRRTGLPFSGGATGSITTASGCGYAVSSPPVVAAEGQVADLAVTTAPGCAWSSASNAAWAAVVAGASGTGPGTVRVSVVPSALRDARTARIAIADQVVALTQEGLPVPEPRSTTWPRARRVRCSRSTSPSPIPNTTPAPIAIQFLKDDGTTSTIVTDALAPRRARPSASTTCPG